MDSLDQRELQGILMSVFAKTTPEKAKEAKNLVSTILKGVSNENNKQTEETKSSVKIQDTKTKQAPKPHVVLLGMHRSGTSMVAGILQSLGLYCGESNELLPPDQDNPKGYFERNDVIKLNALLLATVNANWHKGLANLDTQNFSDIAIRDFEPRAQRIINQLEQHSPWLIKDPRCCLTYSVWRKLIPSSVVVIVYRHPIAVANSLSKRDSLPKDYALALWEKYMLSCLRSTIGLPRVIVSYQNLLNDPIYETEQLCKELVSLGLYQLQMPSTETILNFIDPSLNHTKTSSFSTQGLSSTQLAIFQALENKTALDWKEENFPVLSEEASTILSQDGF